MLECTGQISGSFYGEDNVNSSTRGVVSGVHTRSREEEHRITRHPERSDFHSNNNHPQRDRPGVNRKDIISRSMFDTTCRLFVSTDQKKLPALAAFESSWERINSHLQKRATGQSRGKAIDPRQ
ncbi:unnamed protein product [Ectocarpus sp. 6 AP-2014]